MFSRHAREPGSVLIPLCSHSAVIHGCGAGGAGCQQVSRAVLLTGPMMVACQWNCISVSIHLFFCLCIPNADSVHGKVDHVLCPGKTKVSWSTRCDRMTQGGGAGGMFYLPGPRRRGRPSKKTAGRCKKAKSVSNRLSKTMPTIPRPGRTTKRPGRRLAKRGCQDPAPPSPTSLSNGRDAGSTARTDRGAKAYRPRSVSSLLMRLRAMANVCVVVE